MPYIPFYSKTMEMLIFVVLILFCACCHSLKLDDKEERQQNATLGEKTILTCTFSDYDVISSIQWFKSPNFKPINEMNNSRYNVFNDDDTNDGITTSELTIDVVKFTDKGTYECNGIGKTDTEISKGKVLLVLLLELNQNELPVSWFAYAMYTVF